MSEFWVSKKKYFCKYCDIYIADDAPSRQQHENGLRHKGSVERFIRGIYKTGEKQKKDLEEEKREMKRVEQAAAAAFAEDVGAGLAKLPAPVASTSTAPKKPTPKPSNPFANYSTAQSLGYSDPDAERLAEELELRRSQGIAGEWQIITPLQPPVGSVLEETPSASELPSSEIGVKREAEALPDEDDTRAFKLRKKTLNRRIGEIYDPGMIPVKLKKKEEPNIPQLAPIINTSATGAPKWMPTQWKRPGEKSQESGANSSTAATDDIKVEETSSSMRDGSVSSKWVTPQWSQPLPDLKQEERKGIFGNQEEIEGQNVNTQSNKLNVKSEDDVKEEPQTMNLSEESSSTGLFKKRKAPTGAGRGRREI